MLRPALLAAALAAAFPAHADDQADLAALRAEVQAMKTGYEARIQALEARLAKAEAAAAAPSAAPAASAAPVEAASSAPANPGAFNPAISLILQGGYANLKDIPARQIAGFLTNDAASTPARGFSVDDSELVLASNIDPYFRGYFNATLNDGSVGVEEAWFQTIALGHGLTVKGGRFRSGIGYQNEQHPHAWDFATNNLMYQTLFGEGYGNDGLQLRWVAPTDLFTELGAEIGRGAQFPGTDRNRNGAGSYALYGHIGGDVGESNSWRGGVSYLSTRADARTGTLTDSNGTLVDTAFSGDSRTWMADFVWKWAPLGNPTVRNFKFAAELFRREESGGLSCSGGLLCTGSAGAYQATQYGGYAQAAYQFMPRWRVGYRYDVLDPGSREYGLNDTALPRTDYRPTRHSLMVDYSPSEFSRLRLQVTQDRANVGQDENQWYLRYIYSLGTHGAHTF
ncbi:TonB-dependent receptor [Thiobacillus sedimenti]|uniref:TonB-dependent receptor n=1 Tax=Thiobacillus sedimenti TaxID=3110231 RepID=A0ABZ1CL23_9PROT|nr:TonB-dependent receptor [Thiobacillus sp. SCUT-2]WRS39012.1 TonB-dependent receptor [Thiobacillus sp. SCUT-2]